MLSIKGSDLTMISLCHSVHCDLKQNSISDRDKRLKQVCEFVDTPTVEVSKVKVKITLIKDVVKETTQTLRTNLQDLQT